jgi:alpha-L-arabinofuranosidase
METTTTPATSPTSTTFTTATEMAIADVDRRIFGGFAEHLGRCVYGGIYDPGSPHADADGFRTDVAAALRRLGMPVMRYPGGNFVSSFDWRDSIGPRGSRPTRVDYAWKSLESNAVGVDEFVPWCRKLGCEPMMAVNLGTLGTAEAAALLEYCNLDTPSAWADRRRANGHAAPHAIKYWCLGNEMDGPWQAGHVPAREYALRADAASRIMKGLDGSIQTIAAGSSGRFMKTYMAWDREVLEHCWDTVDLISAHRYSANDSGDSAAYLAEGVEIDRVLSDYAGLIDYVRGLKRGDKRVYLSFDEWNVWYRERNGDGGWQHAPHLLEEVYNVEDALIAAQYLNAFIRRADLVKVACIAQVVNVIAPVMTHRDGLFLQTIFHPFEMLSTHARGQSLRLAGEVATHKAGRRGDAPVLDAAATFDPATGRVTLSVVNRSLDHAHDVTLKLLDRTPTRIAFAQQTGGDDVKRHNSFESPAAVVPAAARAVIVEGKLRVSIPRTTHAVAVVETVPRMF